MKGVQAGESISGIAKVEINPSQPKVRVTFKPEEGQAPKVFVLEKEKCPAYVRNGTFVVNVSGNGQMMYSMRPINGMAKFKFAGFPAGKDTEGKPKDPAPKTKVGKFGAYMTFSAVFEFVEGEFKGMQIPASFPYDFVEGQDEVEGVLRPTLNVKKKEKSQYNALLWEFLEATGVINKVMPYQENCLPRLQKVIYQVAAEFSGTYKEGWMVSLFADVDEKDFA